MKKERNITKLSNRITIMRYIYSPLELKMKSLSWSCCRSTAQLVSDIHGINSWVNIIIHYRIHRVTSRITDLTYTQWNMFPAADAVYIYTCCTPLRAHIIQHNTLYCVDINRTKHRSVSKDWWILFQQNNLQIESCFTIILLIIYIKLFYIILYLNAKLFYYCFHYYLYKLWKYYKILWIL